MATVTETAAQTPQIGSQSEYEPEGLYEFVDGKVVEKPPLGAFDVELASLLVQLMGIFVKQNRLGRVVSELLFRVNSKPRLDLRPDVAFVSKTTWPLERRAPVTAAWNVVPDLVVEVLSPTNRSVEDREKVEKYFSVGTKAVWLVYPPLSIIDVYTSPTKITVYKRGDTLDASPAIPGFTFELVELFGDPLPETDGPSE